MSSLNIVWYQQKAPGSSQSSRPASQPLMRSREISALEEKMVERLSRPTQSSSAKIDRAVMHRLRIDGFLDRNNYVWNKLTLFEDIKKCQWTPNGTVKTTTKL